MPDHHQGAPWGRTHPGATYEGAPLGAGLNLVLLAALVVNVLSFFDLPVATVVLLVSTVALVLVAGLALHFLVLSAWNERNRRHRRWLETQAATDLLEFRVQLLMRERDVELARQAWVRPLLAAIAVTSSAAVVPYQMVGSFAPHPLAGPVNTAWATLALVIGATCTGLAAIAALRQERHVSGDGAPSDPMPARWD